MTVYDSGPKLKQHVCQCLLVWAIQHTLLLNQCLYLFPQHKFIENKISIVIAPLFQIGISVEMVFFPLISFGHLIFFPMFCHNDIMLKTSRLVIGES